MTTCGNGSNVHLILAQVAVDRLCLNALSYQLPNSAISGLKIGYLEHDKDDTEIGEDSFYVDDDYYPDEAESKDGVLPQTTNACNSWKQVADGIELLVKGKTCARMVCKSNSRSKEDNNFTSIRKSEKHDEIVKLGETKICGLRMTSKSKSRTDQFKNATINPEESDEQGNQFTCHNYVNITRGFRIVKEAMHVILKLPL